MENVFHHYHLKSTILEFRYFEIDGNKIDSQIDNLYIDLYGLKLASIGQYLF